MEITLLGPPGARHAGDAVRVAGRQRALLAALALRAPRPVPVDVLLDVLWGDHLPQDPSNALQQRVSALRKQLDPDGAGDVLVPAGGSYALLVEDVDVRRFEVHVQRGRQLVRAGDARAARAELAAGLELWQGLPLDGFADEPWARGEVQRLDELRLAATEDRVDADLRLGGGPELVGELTSLVDAHPLRESLTALLMRALYRAGRQADALTAYDRTRRRLADELGVDPGPALTATYQQVLVQDVGLDDVAPVVGNLPFPVAGLVGRDTAVDEVAQLLARARLVTLTGPGGVGKTSLALAAGHAVPAPRGGTWWVDLAAASTQVTVVSALASALGVRGDGIGGALDLDSLAAALAGRDLMLVVDNCEQVRDDAADVVSRLLAAAPALRVLATSREPLGVAGEHRWPVPPLDVPDDGATRLADVLASPAVQLLLERTRQRNPEFSVTDDTASVAAAVACRLDGIPLALELAAARLTVMSLPQLQAGLDDALDVLTSRSRGTPSRHRTLRATLDWSWDLLDDDQRCAWSALSVVAGSFDLGVAEVLLGAAGVLGSPLDAVSGLVDASLLVAETGHAPARFRLLETVRAYGCDRLHETGLGASVLERHADLVEDAVARFSGTGDPAAFDVDLGGLQTWLDDAREVMSRAVAGGDRTRAQRVAGGLGWLWFLGGLASEGIEWIDQALDDAPDVDAGAALWASGLRATGISGGSGRRRAEVALASARTPTQRVLAEVFAALNEAHDGRMESAFAGLESARLRAAALGGWPLGLCLLMRAQLARLTRGPGVGADASEALELFTRAGVDWARAYAIDLVVEDVLQGGDADRARELASEGLALAQRDRLPELEARMLAQLGTAVHALGDTAAGRRHLELAVHRTALCGNGVALGFVHLAAAALARDRGDEDETVAHLTGALDAFGDAPAGQYGAGLARAALGRRVEQR